MQFLELSSTVILFITSEFHSAEGKKKLSKPFIFIFATEKSFHHINLVVISEINHPFYYNLSFTHHFIMKQLML